MKITRELMQFSTQNKGVGAREARPRRRFQRHRGCSGAALTPGGGALFVGALSCDARPLRRVGQLANEQMLRAESQTIIANLQARAVCGRIVSCRMPFQTPLPRLAGRAGGTGDARDGQQRARQVRCTSCAERSSAHAARRYPGRGRPTGQLVADQRASRQLAYPCAPPSPLGQLHPRKLKFLTA